MPVALDDLQGILPQSQPGCGIPDHGFGRACVAHGKAGKGRSSGQLVQPLAAQIKTHAQRIVVIGQGTVTSQIVEQNDAATGYWKGRDQPWG